MSVCARLVPSVCCATHVEDVRGVRCVVCCAWVSVCCVWCSVCAHGLSACLPECRPVWILCARRCMCRACACACEFMLVRALEQMRFASAFGCEISRHDSSGLWCVVRMRSLALACVCALVRPRVCVSAQLCICALDCLRASRGVCAHCFRMCSDLCAVRCGPWCGPCCSGLRHAARCHFIVPTKGREHFVVMCMGLLQDICTLCPALASKAARGARTGSPRSARIFSLPAAHVSSAPSGSS